jgi:hypothetical protein
MKLSHIIIFAMLVAGISLMAKETTVTGKVINKLTKKPLTGVVIKAHSNGSDITAVTDRFGKYRFSAKPGTYSVKISYFVNNDKIIDKVKIKADSLIVMNFEIDPNILPKEINKDVVLRKAVGRDGGGVGSGSKGYSDAVELEEDVSTPSRAYVMTKESKVGGDDRPAPSDLKPGFIAGETITDALGYSEMGGVSVQSGQAGVLTSGEINDFRKWDLWKDINDGDLKEYRDRWIFYPDDRYTIQLVTMDNRPAVDYEVKLLDKVGNEVWAGKTDNTGKAELWSNIFDGPNGNKSGFAVSVSVNGSQVYKENIKKFHDGINIIPIQEYCKAPDVVDIVFAVDATGSMGDEIGYLKAELSDIIGKLKNQQKGLKINLGSLFYRDETDQYVIRKSDISNDIDKTLKFIEEQSADGGGDYPEAVEMALQEAVNNMKWSKDAVARILFIILDAPPHETPEVKEKLKEIIAKAAMMGIRVVPITCSGIDKSTEYLMRSLALATNGTYVFLTDDSGVGGSHIKPSTDKYDVEKLNDLFIRLISQFTTIPSCSDISPLAGLDSASISIFNKDETRIDETNPENTDIIDLVKCFPNPTSGNLTIEVKGSIEELFIVDITGKILEKPSVSTGKTPIDLGQYPTGIYFVKYMAGGRWGSVKIMLMR